MRWPPGGMSIRFRLILSYLMILGIGGLATSIVGSWIVSSTIMMQAVNSADNTLATALSVYEQQLAALRNTVQTAASGTTIPTYLASGQRPQIAAYLGSIRRNLAFDFLSLADARGRVIVRSPNESVRGDDVSRIGVVRAALAGSTASATEIVDASVLRSEDPVLPGRARTKLLNARGTAHFDKPEETSGMVLLAASPVLDESGRRVGVLYGGILLNGNFALVDRVWNLLFQDSQPSGADLGNVTIFQDGFRIATTVKHSDGRRATGTGIDAKVLSDLRSGSRDWSGRAFVVDGYHISRYQSIRDLEGRTIGFLSAGLLEGTYTSTRNRVILSFFGVATIGFISIIGITYYMIGNITNPIGEMVEATRSITAGRLDQEVCSTAHGEIALLANSFNTMLKSLRQMKADLEEWGRTLEAKVRERTEELGAMQARVAQSERLASVGLLAAGVAHEINNPLGAILSLTQLTLEDVPKEDPSRENLEEVVKQSERCRGIVRGLLDFSRQSEVRTDLVDFNRLIEETLRMISRQSMFFNVAIVKQLEPQLPPVLASRSQFQQVFMNIIMNAVQAMEERGTLTISTNHRPEQELVEVHISDTGKGIPPDQIDRVFDPFFTTKESGRGTGLGLSISYGIVTAHRGTLRVKSDVGRGTTFTMAIPVPSWPPQEAGT
ncbi:MAG: cache domain-containing protein [Bryobacteraceae bacterium]|nr:cache domain-containing protein [Bryobacteraceae bacterium]